MLPQRALRIPLLLKGTHNCVGELGSQLTPHERDFVGRLVRKEIRNGARDICVKRKTPPLYFPGEHEDGVRIRFSRKFGAVIKEYLYLTIDGVVENFG